MYLFYVHRNRYFPNISYSMSEKVEEEFWNMIGYMGDNFLQFLTFFDTNTNPAKIVFHINAYPTMFWIFQCEILSKLCSLPSTPLLNRAQSPQSGSER